MEGRTLGHYRIGEEIGAGGMGTVYRARDEHLGRDVAVKILRAGLCDKDARARFKNEAAALSTLSHPSIATVHDFDTQDDVDFLVMEYVEGETLGDSLADGPVPETELIQVATELAGALEAAHRLGIVHRDLKPDNVMRTHEGRVKILDFGLAKLLRPAPALARAWSATETMGLVGTLPYMAPEQVRGQKVDSRTDIHALGAVLYELATGHRPFREHRAGPLADEILNETPMAPGRRRRGLSIELDRVIMKCLEKNPADRYQSAQELRRDLARLALPGARRLLSRAPRVRRSMLLASVALGSLLIAITWLGRRPEPTAPPGAIPSIAVLPFVDMSSAKDQEYFSDGLAEELRSELNRVPGLRVVGRTSSLRFADGGEDVRTIGQRLSVTSILEGSVRKEGRRMRITARLVDTASSFHLWSATYDRELDDIFAVQEEIARAVTAALQVELLRSWPSTPQTADTEAYNAYLLGRYFYSRQGRGELARSIGYFERAIELDPGYARAWAGLAAAHAFQAGLGYTSPPEAGYTRALEAVERSLALDAALAHAHAVKGWIQMSYQWDWEGADASFQRALSLEPGRAEIESAQLAVALGRFPRALELSRSAVRRDPISAQALTTLGLAAWYGGQTDEAILAYRKILELIPDHQAVHGLLGTLLVTRSRPREALTELEQATDPVWRLPGLAMAHHSLGHRSDSEAALAELAARHGAGGAYNVAQVYAYRGETDEAFAWLDRAFAQHDGGLFLVKVDPLLRNLRSDPRYQALLARLRLSS